MVPGGIEAIAPAAGPESDPTGICGTGRLLNESLNEVMHTDSDDFAERFSGKVGPDTETVRKAVSDLDRCFNDIMESAGSGALTRKTGKIAYEIDKTAESLRFLEPMANMSTGIIPEAGIAAGEIREDLLYIKERVLDRSITEGDALKAELGDVYDRFRDRIMHVTDASPPA